MGHIYTITNRQTGAYYVGSAAGDRRRLLARWCSHKRDLQKGSHHSKYLQRAWTKWGEGEFIFRDIESVEDDNFLLEREQDHITRALSLGRGFCYNVCRVAGNCTGRKFSKESLLKMSLSQAGRSRSEESKARQRETWSVRYGRDYLIQSPSGQVLSLRNIREFCRFHELDPGHIRLLFAGKLKSCKGWTSPGCERKEFRIKSPCGEVYSGITNLKRFCEEHEVPYKSIHRLARGNRKTSMGWSAVDT